MLLTTAIGSRALHSYALLPDTCVQRYGSRYDSAMQLLRTRNIHHTMHNESRVHSTLLSPRTREVLGNIGQSPFARRARALRLGCACKARQGPGLAMLSHLHPRLHPSRPIVLAALTNVGAGSQQPTPDPP